MTQKLTPGTALLLTIPPLLWAGNAIVGRMMAPLLPPITLNFLRWLLALLLLLPLAGGLWRARAVLRTHWRRLTLLGLLGIGLYNALQYLALQTSTPINVTLVASGMPVWMLAVGALFFRARVSGRQVVGAVMSLLGVLVVLSRGDWSHLLALRLVPGDLFMILATIAWSFYSWMLAEPNDYGGLRSDWAAFLGAQVGFGVLWSGLFAAAEWQWHAQAIQWGWPLAAGLAYVAIGPAIIAFRCWGVGVQRAGPGISAFFVNLTPLFAALLSAALLGEAPHGYHIVAFALIVGGIVVSSRRAA